MKNKEKMKDFGLIFIQSTWEFEDEKSKLEPLFPQLKNR